MSVSTILKPRITNTRDIENHALKILVFAPPGNGKTFLASTTGGKTLIISAEAGLLCLAGHDIDVWDITKNEKGELLSSPQERLNRLQEAYTYLLNGTDYKWVYLDSVTEVSQTVVAMLNKQFPDRKDSIVMWGENTKMMTALVKNFRDLPKYHVVFSSLVKVDKDENNKRHTGINASGRIADDMPAWFDEVFFLHVDDDKKRWFWTAANDRIACKDRSGKLDPVEPADLKYIAEKILSASKKGKV